MREMKQWSGELDYSRTDRLKKKRNMSAVVWMSIALFPFIFLISNILLAENVLVLSIGITVAIASFGLAYESARSVYYNVSD